MGKVINGIVIDDDLFQEYHKFKKGEKCDQKKITRLLHFYKKCIVSNIKQYEDNCVELPVNLKAQMVKSGLTKQSLEELAENSTLYKVILSSKSNTFPYVNIISDKQRLENNFSASFDVKESRDLAIKHLIAICLHAKKITLYDKYFSSDSSNLELIKRILPQNKLEITYNYISNEHIQLLKEHCDQWNFNKNSQITNRHDRYLIIDERLEIILTSGFYHLNNTSKDFTYIIRHISNSRF